MGRRGPAPKPTAIKKAEGNPGKRKLNTEEPQPLPGVPECPDHLDATSESPEEEACSWSTCSRGDWTMDRWCGPTSSRMRMPDAQHVGSCECPAVKFGC